MGERPYILLSCSMSIDGYLDSATDERLLLSNEADFDRVDGVRAGCDAILVGAETVRRDNPRLMVRAESRRDDRAARGLRPSPVKVTVTAKGQLDADAKFFTTGDAEKLVYCASDTVDTVPRRGSAAWPPWSTAASRWTCAWMTEDLYARGVCRLMVEGGGIDPHPVPDRAPRRRAAPRGGAVLRRRLARPAVRQRRRVPVEPRPPGDAGRGAPDRRRRAAAVRAVAAVRRPSE